MAHEYEAREVVGTKTENKIARKEKCLNMIVVTLRSRSSTNGSIQDIRLTPMLSRPLPVCTIQGTSEIQPNNITRTHMLCHMG